MTPVHRVQTNVGTAANTVKSLSNGNNSANIFNEIISKRIKISTSMAAPAPASVPVTAVTSPTAAPVDNSQINKIIQYFSKSLDSSKESESATTSNGQQKHKSNDWAKSMRSTTDWPLSPPSPSNAKAQIKRKKKDNPNTNQVAAATMPTVATVSQTPLNSSSSAVILVGPACTTIENDTLQHMKNLDLNNELETNKQQSTSTPPSSLHLGDVNARNQLWSLLCAHTPTDELVQRFGVALHDKLTFWDLVQLKLKHSPHNHLKTIYDIIDDYTLLYSNMSLLLERFANEQTFNSNTGRKVCSNPTLR